MAQKVRNHNFAAKTKIKKNVMSHKSEQLKLIVISAGDIVTNNLIKP